jgi:hypothetical protein
MTPQPQQCLHNDVCVFVRQDGEDCNRPIGKCKWDTRTPRPDCEGTRKKTWKHRESPNHSSGATTECPDCGAPLKQISKGYRYLGTLEKDSGPTASMMDRNRGRSPFDVLGWGGEAMA